MRTSQTPSLGSELAPRYRFPFPKRKGSKVKESRSAFTTLSHVAGSLARLRCAPPGSSQKNKLVAGLQLAEVSGIEPIAQMIAQEIERHHRYRNEHARDQHPRIVLDILRIHRLRQQIAPTRRGLLDSQSEQRERALTEDVTRDRKRRVDCGEAKHRGNHMAEEYAAA